MGSPEPTCRPHHAQPPGLQGRESGPPGREAGRPMKRKPIDFRELLERLLPLERLRPADRLRVQRALVSGVAAEIEQAGLMALHQLEQLGAIRRLPPSSANGGESALRFQTPRALDIITLELPPTIQRDGIEVHPRLALVAQARTGLDQVRRLMRLDDP